LASGVQNSAFSPFLWSVWGFAAFVNAVFLLWVGRLYKRRLRSFELITKQHAEALEKLQSNEELLLHAQRIGHMGSLKHDVATGSYLASPEFRRIYGMNSDQENPTEEMLKARIHPDDYAGFEEARGRARREKTNFEYEYRLLLPDASIRRVFTAAQPVLDNSGSLIEQLAVTLEVTDRRQAECTLCHAQADLEHVDRTTTMGELAASLAHEIIQPIAAAVTNANTCVRWLERDQPDLVEAREAAARLIKDTTRAAEIINRIRQLFKKNLPQRALMDVNEIVREMIVLLRNEAMECSVSIKTELAPDLPLALADRVQLQQVLMNLMVNGIDAMREVEGVRELTIQSRRTDDGQLQISVCDTGVGLRPQQANQIFTAFYTTKPHGTGLGLRISRSIIEAHCGRLWATDNSPRGAIFHFTLPIQAEASA
jgi:C4-dicarboxylate-specific signal transduction histidine kinase